MFHWGLLSSLGVDMENEERPQQVVFCRAGDGTGRLDLEERKESDMCSLPSCFAGFLASLTTLAGGFPGNACYKSWELGNRMSGEEDCRRSACYVDDEGREERWATASCLPQSWDEGALDLKERRER